MRLVRWLFHLDDLVPYEVTHRRRQRLRAFVIGTLILAFPGVFLSYQQARFQPFVDRITEDVAEMVTRNSAGSHE